MSEENIQRLAEQGLRMYTLDEVEPVLGISHRTMLKLIKAGDIKAVKVGGRWRVSEDALKQFVNGNADK